MAAPVVATDATAVTVNGKQCYIRNFSTDRTVLYAAMAKKTLKVMKEVPFLKNMPGILCMATKRPYTISVSGMLSVICICSGI